VWVTNISNTRVGRRGKRTFTQLPLAVLFPLMILPAVMGMQEISPTQSIPSAQYTISVSVDLVALHATVRNHNGKLVSGLGVTDFQVYEDGILQKIESFSHEDIPVTVGLVVDNSGSMRPKRAEVITAVLAFARSSNPEDQMFVVSFNENVSFGLPDDQPFTDQESQLRAALSKIGADGKTALYDAIGAALEHLKKGVRDKKVLIVISDGGDNASHKNLAQVMALATQSGAIIYTIGLFDESDEDRNPLVLSQLARATGGETFLPGTPKDVFPVCERIARDIRNQYSILYLPSNGKPDGTYRVIQVRAGMPGSRERLSVRTKAGYFAPLKAGPGPVAGATP
jgi:Ca-activated chloride channel homolog